MPSPPRTLALFAAVPLLGIAADARAEQEFAIEPRGSFAMVDDSPYPGVGASIDLGLSLDLEPIVVQPELRFVGQGYPSLPGGSMRVMAGLRAGIAWKFEPSIFVHLGYGFVGNDTFTSSGYAIDAGLTADYRLKRWLTIGGSLGYEVIANGAGANHGAFGGPRIGFWIE